MSRILALFATLAVQIAAAQAPPIRAWNADLERYYFASPKMEQEARADLNQSLKTLQSFKKDLSTGTKLFEALEAYEQVERAYRKHEAYLHLRCSLDRKDPACEARDQLESQTEAESGFFPHEILALPQETLNQYFAAEPRLAPYRFAIEDMRRDAGHLLPEEEQALLDRLQPVTTDWQYDLYQQILGDIPFGAVQTKDGAVDVVRQRNLLAANPDAKVREEAFKKRYNGLASRRDTFAFSLIHTVKAQDSLAQTHHYADAPSRKYESLYLDPAETKSLLNEMGRQGDFAKRLEKIRASNFEKNYGAPMQAWDLSAPPRIAPPTVSLADLPRLYHDAFSGLGPEYQAAFDALINPANGRADVVPGGAPNRYPGGFSVGFSGSTSILFFGRFDGTFKDLSVIAHEGGHAVHRGLMSDHGVLPVYASGPHFLFESFAAFNELVLADYMAEHASSPDVARYYREEWLGIKGLDAFYGAQDALLEQQIYDGVAAGTIRDADALDKVTAAVDSRFSIFSASTPELRNRWITVGLMYEDPLYDVNYVYGGLLALKYYQLYSSDREKFVPRYLALLKNGFNATPAQLLKHFLDIDLSGSTLLSDDSRLLDQRLRQLEGHP